MGDIAREVALKFHYACGSKILVYSPTSPVTRWTGSTTTPNEPVIPHTRVNSLEELLKDSDVVSLHCPAVPETFKMMSTEQFALMKNTAIFLNLGRGELVDEDALYQACKKRQIMGAGLDCFATEPVTAATYGNTLFTLDNIVVLPHVGASTIEVTRDSTVTAVQTAFSYCKEGSIGSSTLVRELEWADLKKRPTASATLK
jgi:phosphoglycerate dehydrogenase-like enzyme